MSQLDQTRVRPPMAYDLDDTEGHVRPPARDGGGEYPVRPPADRVRPPAKEDDTEGHVRPPARIGASEDTVRPPADRVRPPA